jgi:hypothetical protein
MHDTCRLADHDESDIEGALHRCISPVVAAIGEAEALDEAPFEVQALGLPARSRDLRLVHRVIGFCLWT